MKQLALRQYDLACLATAASYDLRSRAERARSTADLENLFFRLVRDLAPDLFIEAGAKDAGSSRRARSLFDKGRVVAFEANPYTYRRFRALNAAPELRVEYLHLALSDEPGVVSFYVGRREDGGAHADGKGSLLERSDRPHGNKKVAVKATSIDRFFGDHRFDRCALWIDVEGASRQVLQGARQVLRRTAVVFIEVEDTPYWQGQDWLAGETAACLYDAGLVAMARDFQLEHQYNVVFVREELLEAVEVRVALADYRSSASRHTSPERGIALLRRRARKLAQRPEQFFADSRHGIVRRLGRAIWR